MGVKRAGTFSVFERRYAPLMDEGGSLRVMGWDDLAAAAGEMPVDPRHVWTVITGDDQRTLYIVAGIHYVNREGYVYCERAWPDSEELAIGYVY